MDATPDDETTSGYSRRRGEDMDADDLGIAGLEDPVVIGRGGFATVLRAYQPAFRRTVAVKLLSVLEVDELTRERFQRECQAMGLLSEHPSIVTVLDAGFNDAGRPYLVMAYMPEGSLQDRMHAEGAMGWQQACRTAIKIAGALQAAHDAGILHRDVKPANVLISQYGDPQLSDFGIARITGGHETSSGVITASLAYAAPETIEGQRPHAPSDLYSLAAMTYALTTGRPPHGAGDASSVGALIRSILHDPVPAPANAPDDFAEVLRTALSKRPDERFDSVREFGEALRDVQERHGIQQTELALLRVPEPAASDRPTEPPPERTRDIAELHPRPDRATEESVADASERTRNAGDPAAVGVGGGDGEATADQGSRPDRVRRSSVSRRQGRAAHRRMRRWAWGAAAGIAAVVIGLLVLAARDETGQRPVEASELPPQSADEVDTGDVPSAVDQVILDTGDRAAIRAAYCADRAGPELSGRDLRGLDLTKRSMHCADLSGATLDGTDLGGSDFTGANFAGASLVGAVASAPVQFDHASFVGADLTGFAGTGGVDLVAVDATDATLTDVDFGPDANLDDSIGLDALQVGG